MPSDPTPEVVDTFIVWLETMFGPASPPRGGVIRDVRFFAMDGAGIPQQLLPQCPNGEPSLLWVRLDRRFEASLSGFPAAVVQDAGCNDAVPTVAIEIGVARCSTLEAFPNWSQLTLEAEISMDDSWRLHEALRQARCQLRSAERAVAIDTVAPSGPAGGAMVWTGMAYVQLIEGV